MVFKKLFQRKKQKLGIALGSGGARGFAHLGILKALSEMGIEPDIVAGVSSGAIMGAYYVSNNLSQCEDWAKNLDRKAAFKLMDFHLIPKGGFVKGHRLIEFLKDQIGQQQMEDLPKPFAVVATDIIKGEEVVIRSGSLANAIRASIAYPGLLPSVFLNDRWLVDGGVVNPVPISACRALGADKVIAVNLNDEVVGKRFKKEELKDVPGMVDVIMTSITILQDRVTRARMLNDKPDIILSPQLGHVGLLDFQYVDQAIEIGRKTVESAKEKLLEIQNEIR